MNEKKPNIILINCDDLGYGDLGCYGSDVHKTPAIDKMAQEGIRFTDFYMSSPVCTPSRGALMTGCYPPRIDFGSFDGRWVLFPGQRYGLNPEEETIATKLKDQGYSTMIVGKWHCGDQPDFLPTRHGFDQYYGLPYSNDMGRQKGAGEEYPPLPLIEDEEVLQEQPDQSSLTERYVEKAVKFIRNNKENPFFLYLAHMYVHLPLYTPDRFMKQSENGSYGAAVECIDWSVEVILEELKRLELDQDTLVIFTSDNGSRNDTGVSNSPLRGHKGTTWEGGIRVPCIMRWPGKIPTGNESNEIVTAMDLMPTLTLLAGGELSEDRIIDGKDIRPLIFAEEDAQSPRKVFFYYLQNNLEAVRVGKWKLHVRKGDKEIKELYNLEEDIAESNNLYDEYPEIVKELKEYLESCRQDIGDAACRIEGANCRPKGEVEEPDTLTHYDPDHPYIIAMYDLEDRG